MTEHRNIGNQHARKHSLAVISEALDALTAGRSIDSVAQRFGVPVNTLSKWSGQRRWWAARGVEWPRREPARQATEA